MKMKCFHMYPIWQLIANYGNDDKNNPQSKWHFLKFLWYNFHIHFIRKICWQVTCKIQHQPTDWMADKTSLVLSPFPYITSPPSIFLYHTFNSPYKFKLLCKLQGFCSGIAEDSVLLGYDGVPMGNRIQTFWGNTVPSTSRINTS